jgi:hypothetical protein
MDADTDRQADRVLLRHTCIQHAEGFDHPETGTHGAVGIVFVRPGIAKIHQQPIAEILGDMAIKVLDDLRTGGVIGLDDLAQVFRVELSGKRRGVDQVTEEHRELTALSLHGLGWGWRTILPYGLGVWHRLRCPGALWRRVQRTAPHQDAACLVLGQALGVNEFRLEVVEIGIIQGKPTLQGRIGDAALLAQDLQNLGEYIVKCHGGTFPRYSQPVQSTHCDV